MDIWMAISLIAIGVTGRLFFRGLLPHGNDFVMFDMFAVVGSVSVVGGAYLDWRLAMSVPLITMAISDAYLNTAIYASVPFVIGIMAFTWTGFLMVAVVGRTARDARFTTEGFASIFGAGILGVLVFDLWTNFGVWLGPFYAHNLGGLILCYTMALPFTLGHLLTTAAILPLVSLPYLYLKDSVIGVGITQTLPSPVYLRHLWCHHIVKSR